MAYIVKEISDKKGFKDFLSIPESVYREDPNWVPPQKAEIKRVLDSRKNPYFKNASLRIYVCYSDGQPVSRSILVINQLHWSTWKKKSAFFGFFESLNDGEAVEYLFHKMEEVGLSLGAEYLEGPFNPNHYSELGILVDNFTSEPIFFETYNPSYYPRLLEETGFSGLIRFHTRIITDTSAIQSENFGNYIPEQEVKDITIRKFNIWKLNRDLEIMRDINNDAFKDNWHFLPLSKDEYHFTAKFLFFLSYPRHILFAEYKGKPVGVMQFVLNINRLLKPCKGKMMPWDLLQLMLKRGSVKELVIFTIGIKKAFQHTRISALMLKSMLKEIQKYPIFASTWTSDDNKSVIHTADLLGTVPNKHFVIYSKSLL